MPTPQYKLIEVMFPLLGLHESSSVYDQPENTSPLTLNVRGYDLVAKRDRGCQRPGLVKFVADRQNTDPIESICVAVVDGEFKTYGPEDDEGDGFAYEWAGDSASPFNEGTTGSAFLITDNPADPITYLVVSDPLVTIDATTDNMDGSWTIDYTAATNSPNGATDVTITAPGSIAYTIHYPGQAFTSFQAASGDVGQTYSGAATSLPTDLTSGETLNIDSPAANLATLAGTMHCTDNAMDPMDLPVSASVTIIYNGIGAPSTPTPYIDVAIGVMGSHGFSLVIEYNANTGTPGTYTANASVNGITLNFSVTQ